MREKVANLQRSLTRNLDLACKRAQALDRVCSQAMAARLGSGPADGSRPAGWPG